MEKTINSTPLISVVTIALNAEVLLEETFKSVADQKFNDFQYILIDGGSKDGSLGLFEKYQDLLDVCVF